MLSKTISWTFFRQCMDLPGTWLHGMVSQFVQIHFQTVTSMATPKRWRLLTNNDHPGSVSGIREVHQPGFLHGIPADTSKDPLGTERRGSARRLELGEHPRALVEAGDGKPWLPAQHRESDGGWIYDSGDLNLFSTIMRRPEETWMDTRSELEARTLTTQQRMVGVNLWKSIPNHPGWWQEAIPWNTMAHMAWLANFGLDFHEINEPYISSPVLQPAFEFFNRQVTSKRLEYAR